MPAPKRDVLNQRALVECIRKYLYIKGKDISGAAKALGISERTFYSRLKNPSTFTLGEINRLAQFLRIPRKELEPILPWGCAA